MACTAFLSRLNQTSWRLNLNAEGEDGSASFEGSRGLLFSQEAIFGSDEPVQFSSGF